MYRSLVFQCSGSLLPNFIMCFIPLQPTRKLALARSPIHIALFTFYLNIKSPASHIDEYIKLYSIIYKYISSTVHCAHNKETNLHVVTRINPMSLRNIKCLTEKWYSQIKKPFCICFKREPFHTFWLSPGRRWTAPAPARTCGADLWCCVSGRGRPPVWRAACSSESTAAQTSPEEEEEEEETDSTLLIACVQEIEQLQTHTADMLSYVSQCSPSLPQLGSGCGVWPKYLPAPRQSAQ